MTVRYLGTEDLPVAKLTMFPGNARCGDIPKLRESLREHGQFRMLLVRQVDGKHIVLAGNQTLTAAIEEGIDQARCELIECSDRDAVKINLADNRLSDIATDATELLSELLSILDGDYTGTGWTPMDVDQILNFELPPGFPEFDEPEDPGPGTGPREVTCPECGHAFRPANDG